MTDRLDLEPARAPPTRPAAPPGTFNRAIKTSTGTRGGYAVQKRPSGRFNARGRLANTLVPAGDLNLFGLQVLNQDTRVGGQLADNGQQPRTQ